MTERGRKNGRHLDEEIELRLDDLLGRLGSVFQEAMDRLETGGEAEVVKERSFHSERGPIRASAGIRIRTAGQAAATPSEASPSSRPTDKPVNRPHSPVAPQEPAPRDMSATVFSEPGHWSLVAELPGIGREDVSLAQEQDELSIQAKARGRTYAGRFSMPPGANLQDIEISVQNGILELSCAVPNETETGK